MQARALVLTALAVGAFLLMANPAVAQKRPSLLILPFVPSADMEVEEGEEVDELFLRAARGDAAFTVESLDDYEKRNGSKPARRLLQCSDDLACVEKNLRRSDYDLVIVGKIESEGEDRRSVRIQAYNLDERETRRTQTFGFTKERLGARRVDRWVETMLANPTQLVDMEEEAAPAPQRARRERPAVASTPAPAPARHTGPSLPSGDEIEDGVRQAAHAYLAGDVDRALGIINRVVSNPCRCDMDRQAYTMKAMLEEFRGAFGVAESALQRRNGTEAVTEFQKLGGLDSSLADEARRLGLSEQSAYVQTLNTKIADAYVVLAAQQINNWAYVAAKESYEKALEFAPGHPEASDELGKMLDVYVPRLMRRANVEALSEPENAKRFLKQVMELVGPGHPMYKDAERRLEEIDY